MRAAPHQKRRNDMTIEPKLEPASRPGPRTASVAAVAAIGALVIYYWPQIKAALNLG